MPMWLKNAWDNVQPTAIRKCFIVCGFPDQSLSVESEENEGINEFEEFVAEHGLTLVE